MNWENNKLSNFSLQSKQIYAGLADHGIKIRLELVDILVLQVRFFFSLSIKSTAAIVKQSVGLPVWRLECCLGQLHNLQQKYNFMSMDEWPVSCKERVSTGYDIQEYHRTIGLLPYTVEMVLDVTKTCLVNSLIMVLYYNTFGLQLTIFLSSSNLTNSITFEKNK